MQFFRQTDKLDQNSDNLLKSKEKRLMGHDDKRPKVVSKSGKRLSVG